MDKKLEAKVRALIKIVTKKQYKELKKMLGEIMNRLDRIEDHLGISDKK